MDKKNIGFCTFITNFHESEIYKMEIYSQNYACVRSLNNLMIFSMMKNWTFLQVLKFFWKRLKLKKKGGEGGFIMALLLVLNT